MAELADEEILLRVRDVGDAIILLLMIHCSFWLEYLQAVSCTCKLQQHVLKQNAAEDGPVPVKLIRFTSSNYKLQTTPAHQAAKLGPASAGTSAPQGRCWL